MTQKNVVYEDEEAVEFTLTPVDDYPDRTYKKGSQYDPFLDYAIEFINGVDEDIVAVPMEHPLFNGKKSDYVRGRLKGRIDSRNLPLTVSVINNIPYLEIIK